MKRVAVVVAAIQAHREPFQRFVILTRGAARHFGPGQPCDDGLPCNNPDTCNGVGTCVPQGSCICPNGVVDPGETW